MKALRPARKRAGPSTTLSPEVWSTSRDSNAFALPPSIPEHHLNTCPAPKYSLPTRTRHDREMFSMESLAEISLIIAERINIEPPPTCT